MRYKNKILIATGGTGGHVVPAYSLAQHLNKRDFQIEITTDYRGLRYIKKSKHFRIKVISSSSIFKKNLILSFFSFFKILYAMIISIFYLYNSRPNIIFGMGGYSSFPICIAAKILRIPFIIYENNLFLGKANKYLLPFANKIIVSYKDLEGVKKKYRSKVIVTGNIIRKEILEFKKKKIYDKKKIFVLLILGGSQAAKVFADKLPSIFIKLKRKKIKFKVIQQCLNSQKTRLSKFYKKNNLNFRLFNYHKKITDYLSEANLVITRAGASMLAELINCKIPFISIPLPTSADNHQLKNALYFQKKGYGFIVEEKQINKKLFPLIKSFSKDKSSLNKVINKQKKYNDFLVYKKIDKIITNLIYEKH